MSKNNKPAVVAVAPSAAALDWGKETARMEASAKEKGGTRGDQLGKIAKFVASEQPASILLRNAAGERGAQAFIDAPRNVLAKLQKLAECVVNGTPWCSREALDPANKRSADASVAVALHSLGAGDERQKQVVAAAMARYPGGANAQMPAALDACAFVGIVERKQGGSTRNAEYSIKNRKLADKLLPPVPTVTG